MRQIANKLRIFGHSGGIRLGGGTAREKINFFYVPVGLIHFQKKRGIHFTIIGGKAFILRKITVQEGDLK